MLTAQEGSVGGLLGEAERVRRELSPEQLCQALMALKNSYDSADPDAPSIAVPEAVQERFAVLGLSNTATFPRLFLLGSAFLSVLRNIGSATLADVVPTDVSDDVTRSMLEILTHLRRHNQPDCAEPVSLEEFPDNETMD